VGDPDDWESFKRTPTQFSFAARQRIRESMEDVHGQVVARLKVAEKLNDTATRHGLATEVRALVDAERHGEPEDVRAAFLCIGASAVLLAERADRPADLELERGSKRTGTKRWKRLDLSVPEDLEPPVVVAEDPISEAA
jgi:hypothetical protein